VEKHVVRGLLVSVALIVTGTAGSAPQTGSSSRPNTILCAAPNGIVFAPEGLPPQVSMAADSHLAENATVPACVGWDHEAPLVLATVAGRFRAAEDDAVLRQIGAISAYSGMQYWSVTDRRLETLIKSAFAVESPTTQQARADFLPSEFVRGNELFFLEQDNRLPEPVLYRLSVIERNAGHLVVEFSNVSRIRRFFITWFEPGDMRTVFFLDREDGYTWTCYGVSGLRARALAHLFVDGKSQRNRLLALFGHITQAIIPDTSWAN
jgi:hypothetical protein